VLGEARPGTARSSPHRHGEAEQHSGDGGVHPGPVHENHVATASGSSSTNNMAGTIIPPTAAATGREARRTSRRSPATNSRLSSRPATKKKTASRPSEAHCPRVRSRCSPAEPDLTERGVGIPPRRVRPGERHDGRHDEQQPAYGLRPKNLGDPACLGPGAAVEEATGGTRTPSSHFGAIVLSATLRNSTTVPKCDLR
jgi:hypothetical protein